MRVARSRARGGDPATRVLLNTYAHPAYRRTGTLCATRAIATDQNSRLRPTSLSTGTTTRTQFRSTSNFSFNPTRVRLKPARSPSRPATWTMLQPHKGSSETVVHRGVPRSRLGFNPTRVRLKLATVELLRPIMGLQPHKGSSETGILLICLMIQSMLQPHKGSSETRPVSSRRGRSSASTPQGFV